MVPTNSSSMDATSRSSFPSPSFGIAEDLAWEVSVPDRGCWRIVSNRSASSCSVESAGDSPQQSRSSLVVVMVGLQQGLKAAQGPAAQHLHRTGTAIQTFRNFGIGQAIKPM